jgi:hypothetical protein
MIIVTVVVVMMMILMMILIAVVAIMIALAVMMIAVMVIMVVVVMVAKVAIMGSMGGVAVERPPLTTVTQVSIPGIGVICELSLLLILSLASRVVLQVLRFISLRKKQHS